MLNIGPTSEYYSWGNILYFFYIRWQNLPAASDYITMELSSASCDPLVTLRKQLQFIENNVSVAACKKIWPIVLAGVDSLMMSEVIYSIADTPIVWLLQVIMMCHFNDGGGAQLQYDITSGLIPLLSQHCTSLRSSQIMMRLVEPAMFMYFYYTLVY